jgi:hypothetical protein
MSTALLYNEAGLTAFLDSTGDIRDLVPFTRAVEEGFGSGVDMSEQASREFSFRFRDFGKLTR